MGMQPRHAVGPLGPRRRTDTEFAQVIVRIAAIPPTLAYFIFGTAAGWFDSAVTNGIIVSFISYTLLSVSIAIHVWLWPGVYHWRRLAAAIIDFSGLGTLLAIGGEAALPVFGGLLWISIGYGIRYGGRYLILSTALSQITIAIVVSLSSFWQAHSYQTATFVFALAIGPLYAFSLMGRLRASQQAAEEANASKSSFVAQVSHDLRQPIHAIGLIADQLNETALDDRQARLVAQIERSTHSAISQLQTFLNLTTIEAGLLQPRLEPVDLGRLLFEVSAQHVALAGESGTTIHVAKTDQTVLSDATFLNAILQNLLSNAMKHARNSDILIGTRRHGRRIAICVYDRGPGIPQEEVPQLTERYFRSSKTREQKVPGVGLGLSIVQQLADSLGLELMIKSRLGKGTAVWLTGLEPCAKSMETTPLIEPQYGQPLNGLRILFIEDDDIARDATAAVLARWGCLVVAIKAPPSTLPAFDILVSDFEYADGSRFIDHAILFTHGQPTILISAHQKDDVAQHVAGQALAILQKPTTASELRSALLSAKMRLDSPGHAASVA
jgi:signal transduction histidine kinase